jgi:tetratricopeptide (TPR) repeat protein
VPNDESNTFTLVPLVADFLRKKKPEAVAKTGDLLEKRAYALAVENGHANHECFPKLDVAWPTVAAALPRFCSGPDDRLQAVCSALQPFLNFTGRWDERLALTRDAEVRAVAANDFSSAGWRAYQTGRIYYLRGQSAEVLACACRAESHWIKARAGARERATAIGLRGDGHQLARNYSAAIIAYRESLELDRALNAESADVAIDLDALAGAERLLGDLDAAERDYREALRIALSANYLEGVAAYMGNLSAVALERKDKNGAEALAREALLLAEKVGRQELIAINCQNVALAIAGQGRKSEAYSYVCRAVEIYTRLGSPHLAEAHQLLKECES